MGRRAILFLKAHVRGHMRRRGEGGAPHYVRPHERRPALLLSGNAVVSPEVEAFLPGATRATRLLARRLFPNHRLAVGAAGQDESWLGMTSFEPTSITSIAFPETAAGDTRTARTGSLAAGGTLTIALSLPVEGRPSPERESKTAVARTLLHEIGHAFAAARLADAPEEMRREILAQWWAEAGKAATADEAGEEVRREDNAFSATGSAATVYAAMHDIPFAAFAIAANAARQGTNTEDWLRGAAGRRAYYASFDEWMAERFVEWCRTTRGPMGALERFFHGLIALLNDAFARALTLLGVPPRDRGAFARFADAAWAGKMPSGVVTAS